MSDLITAWKVLEAQIRCKGDVNAGDSQGDPEAHHAAPCLLWMNVVIHGIQ